MKNRYVYGTGSMGWEPEPELPITRCVDPLGDARKALLGVKINDPSARPDTEDAANRVALAIEYLRMAMNRG
jgi:hypothetical protein